MNIQLITLIDLEIGKLTAAREALVGPGPGQQQSEGEQPQQPITAAALLDGVDVKEFPLFRDTNDNHHRQTQPIKKRKAGGMSEEGRAAVAAAQKARWAKKRAEEKKGRRTA